MRLINENGLLSVAFLALANAYGINTNVTESVEQINRQLQEKWRQSQLTHAYQITGKPPEDADLVSLNQLDYTYKMAVTKTDYTGVLFLGATRGAIVRRLAWLNSYADIGLKTIHVYLLGGERNIAMHPAATETPEALLLPAELPFKKGWLELLFPLPEQNASGRISLKFPTTEAQMMELEFRRSDIQNTWTYEVVNALAQPKNPADPNGEKRPPNTGDTVREWLIPTEPTIRREPTPGKYLILSGQPWCEYQKLVVERIYYELLEQLLVPNGFQFDVCGPEISPTLSLATSLDTIAKQFFEEIHFLSWQK